MLTAAQMTTLAAAIRADTDQAVIDALDIRNDVLLAELYNALTATAAWVSNMLGSELFELTDVAKFDNLNAGQRDAWRLMLDFAPVDFTRQKVRKATQDVWGNTDSIPVLEGCRRLATKAELALGGSSATTNTVTALKLNWEGLLTANDVSYSLNANP